MIWVLVAHGKKIYHNWSWIYIEFCRFVVWMWYKQGIICNHIHTTRKPNLRRMQYENDNWFDNWAMNNAKTMHNTFFLYIRNPKASEFKIQWNGMNLFNLCANQPNVFRAFKNTHLFSCYIYGEWWIQKRSDIVFSSEINWENKEHTMK